MKSNTDRCSLCDGERFMHIGGAKGGPIPCPGCHPDYRSRSDSPKRFYARKGVVRSALPQHHVAGMGIVEDNYDESSDAGCGFKLLFHKGWNSDPKYGTKTESKTFVIIDGLKYLKKRQVYRFNKRPDSNHTGDWELVDTIEYDPPVLESENELV